MELVQTIFFQLLPLEQLLGIGPNELLPIALREHLVGIGPNELLPIAPTGAIGRKWSKRIAPNCSRGIN